MLSPGNGNGIFPNDLFSLLFALEQTKKNLRLYQSKMYDFFFIELKRCSSCEKTIFIQDQQNIYRYTSIST